MPHLILEHSANVLEKETFLTLFEKCHHLLAETLPTERKSCVSRAIEYDQYYVGEGRPNSAFIHVAVKVKAGRTAEVLKKTGEALLAAVKEHCLASSKQLLLKVSVEIVELGENYFS